MFDLLGRWQEKLSRDTMKVFKKDRKNLFYFKKSRGYPHILCYEEKVAIQHVISF